MKRTSLVLPLLIAAGTAWLWPQQSVEHVDTLNSPVPDRAPRVESNDLTGRTAARARPVTKLPRELAQRSSWTNPFNPAFWDSTGWQFNEDSMLAISAAPFDEPAVCVAEFLRDWETVAVSLTFQSPAAMTESSRAERLILDLTGQEDTVLRCRLLPDRVTAALLSGTQVTSLRETSPDDSITFAHVRLALTPNRFLVSGDDRLLLNVPRPAAMTGQRCRLRITAPAQTLISELRFDGE